MTDDCLFRLTDDEKTALMALLKHTIDDDRYPLSPRIHTGKSILAKVQPPQPAPAPLRRCGVTHRQAPRQGSGEPEVSR